VRVEDCVTWRLGANLLEQRLERGRVFLHQLPHLVELRVLPQGGQGGWGAAGCWGSTACGWHGSAGHHSG
jgi:hypothetical protein